MFKFFKRFIQWTNEPSAYDIWSEAFKQLEAEKNANGRSPEYWRIWHEEVCPAYCAMTKSHRKIRVGNDTLTCHILEDMDKPISQRRYFSPLP